MNPTPIQILIAEDHAVVRQGLAAIIKDEPDMTIAAQAENGRQAVELYRQYQPHIVLMDLQMPLLDGVGAIAQIKAEFADARIIVLTTYDGDEDIYRGLQAGAKGYLLKGATAEEMLDAIRKVHQGHKYIPTDVAEKLVGRLNSTALTERELEVLQRLVVGKSNAEIGADLSISERTVKFHLNNIFQKLGVSDRTHAAIEALKRGLARLAT